MEPNEHDDEPPQISRSGVILGAAGLVGAAALAALPGTAAARGGNGGNGGAGSVAGNGGAGGNGGIGAMLVHAEPDVAVKRHHPHYHRSNFERANATVVLSGGGRSMTCRVVDVQPLRHAEGAARGSKDWGGGFSVLMKRTKGDKLGHGTFTASANGKTFPLTISEVAPNVYQAIINRFTPVGS